MAIEWPAELPLWVRSAFIGALEHSVLPVEVKNWQIITAPDEQTRRAADEVSREFQSSASRWPWLRESQNDNDETQNVIDEKMWGPEILGFFNCKTHFHSSLETGIYLFMDRIKACQWARLDFATRTAAVFCHELGHYALHQFSRNDKVSFDPNNFEEPFCEELAYKLVFGKDRLGTPEVNFGRGLRTASFNLFGKDSELSFYYPRHGFRGWEASRFVKLPRIFPYEWFGALHTAQDRDSIAPKRVMENLLSETLVRDYPKSCPLESIRIVLLNAQPGVGYPNSTVSNWGRLYSEKMSQFLKVARTMDVA